jgi:hypothetical protein
MIANTVHLQIGYQHTVAAGTDGWRSQLRLDGESTVVCGALLAAASIEAPLSPAAAVGSDRDLDEATVVAMAGTHDLANPALTEPTFCGALRWRREHHRAASAPAAR